jgi:FkbM family methyltransferase
VYVDVGAFHPFHYSNTYVLHKRGWHGVNIDPNPESISLFKKHRPRDTNVQCGVAVEKSEQTYYVYNHQSCNTFSNEQAKLNESKKHLRLLSADKVPCLPLHQVLAQHLPEEVHVDLLNIDVEGMDLLVLQTVDWKQFAPRIVVIESEVRKGSDLFGNPTYLFLKEKGYELRAWMGASLIFECVVAGK